MAYKSWKTDHNILIPSRYLSTSFMAPRSWHLVHGASFMVPMIRQSKFNGSWACRAISANETHRAQWTRFLRWPSIDTCGTWRVSL